MDAVAGVLLRAAELVEGCWTPETPGALTVDGDLCPSNDYRARAWGMLGALERAAFEHLRGERAEVDALVDEALKLLAPTLEAWAERAELPYRPRAGEDRILEVAMFWNQAPGRTADDVARLLRGAAVQDVRPELLSEFSELAWPKLR